MAVMVNIIPVDLKQNTAVQNVSNKAGTKSAKSESGFAQALTTETDKNAMDVDSKGKNNDTNQLMAAMAAMTGLVVPVVEPVDTLETASATQVQLTSAVSAVSQDQLGNIIPVAPQDQLGSTVTVAPQDQLGSTVPVVAQDQLGNTVPVVVQDQLGNTAPVVAQDQLGNTAPVVAQDQLGNTAPVAPQAQSSNVVVEDPQLAALLSSKTAVTTQVNELAKLQAQAQLQNQSSISKVDVAVDSTKNTELLANNPVISTIASPVTTMGNTNILGKNTNKQPEGKKIVVDQLNIEETEGINNSVGVVETTNVKPVIVSQGTVGVVDGLSKESTESTDLSLPNQGAKSSDLFASMLTQEGMKVQGQSLVEGKSAVTQPVSDSYNITTQIVDQARLVAGNKNTEMIIQLKPEHLGELTFKVSVENGVVSASFHSNNPEVRSVIESSLYQLKQEMSNQGLKVDNVGVYAGLGEFFSNQQQSGTNQQPVVKFQNKKTEEDFLDVFEATDSKNSVLDGTGVDYRA